MKRLLTETGKGLESIRFSVAENLDNLKKNLEEAREDLKYYNEPALMLHGPFLDLNPMCYDSKIRQVTMDRFNECYEAAQELGAMGIVYHSCMIPQIYFTVGWADRMVDFWNRFLEGKSGITIAMENVLDREIQPFVEVAERVEHPDFGLCVDVGHAHCYSSCSSAEWIRAAGSYLKHVHLHDNDGTGDQHKALGKGNLPLDDIFRELKKLPQEMTMTLENQRMEDFHEGIRILEGYGVTG